MTGKFKKLAKRVGKGIAGAATAYAMSQNVMAVPDSNWYFETTPFDMDSNKTGVQWVRDGNNFANKFEVRLKVGPDVLPNLTISGISFVMNDFDATAGTNYWFSSASVPDVTDARDIFYNKIMAYNTVSTNFSVANNRLIDTLQDTRVPATNFVNTFGLYGNWFENISETVALGNLTNVARSLGTFAITVNDGSTSYNISSSLIKRLPTPVYELEDVLSVPEPGTAGLIGLGAATLAAVGSRKRRKDDKGLTGRVNNHSYNPMSGNSQRVHMNRGQRRT